MDYDSPHECGSWYSPDHEEHEPDTLDEFTFWTLESAVYSKLCQIPIGSSKDRLFMFTAPNLKAANDWDKEDFAVVVGQASDTPDHPEGILTLTCNRCDKQHQGFMNSIACTGELSVRKTRFLISYLTVWI
jgi:hypothetical protein